MNIIKKHLPKNCYNPNLYVKNKIYLHHTISSTVESSWNWWSTQQNFVSTAYIIDKDGYIYECFNPNYWAWHLGKYASKIYNKHSVGIELVNEGPLVRKSDGNYTWFDGKGKYETKNVYTLNGIWRNYLYFATYPNKQIKATIELLKYLTDKFNISKKMCPNLNFDKKLIESNDYGIQYHCNVLDTNTDISPAFPIEEVQSKLYKKENI